MATFQTESKDDQLISGPLSSSALFANGGYLVLPELLENMTAQQLLNEALAVRSASTRVVSSERIDFEGRGGKPTRAFGSAPARELHQKLYGSEQIKAVLGRICGVPVVPLGAGTYTYYEQPDDFLALHRDIIGCDIAVISCLKTNTTKVSAGCLFVYPNHVGASLASVRIAGRSAATPVPLQFGETVVLLGGFVPHEVTPMAEGHERIIAVTCYRLLAGDEDSPR